MGTCKCRFKSTVGIKYIGARAWHDQPIDRIGPIRPPVRPSKGQSGVLQAIDHSVAGSMTAQPPGIRPSALRITTHGQQVASLGGGSYPSAEVQTAYSTAPSRQSEVVPDKGPIYGLNRTKPCFFHYTDFCI